MAHDIRIRDMISPAKRMAGVRYAIRDILVEADKVAARGTPLTLLNIGDPVGVGGFQAPQHLIEAILKAWTDHRYGYAPSCGIPEAREAIAADHGRRGMTVDPSHVIVTAGLSEAIRFLLSALVNPGDQVLLPAPGYPLYSTLLAELGAQAGEYYLDETRGWALDVESLERAAGPTARALVLVSPSNPTGHVFTPEELAPVVEFCRRRGLLLICDEVYDRLVYGGDGIASSAAQLCGSDVPVVTLNGLSKNWLMPGARVGWMVFHNPQTQLALIEAIGRLANARLSAPAPQQWAVRPALEGPQDHLVQFRADLAARAQAIAEGLRDVPFASVVVPQAAFYAMPRLHLDHPALAGFDSDHQVVVSWLRRTGVVTVPGSGFGQAPGTHHFRVVTLAPPDVLRRAMASLGEVAGAGAGN